MSYRKRAERAGRPTSINVLTCGEEKTKRGFVAHWRNPYGSCPVCGEVLDNCDALFANYHERCLPPCEICHQEIRADLCAAVYRAAGGKWTARHKTPCPD